jgi:anaerobic selenocysteine-containing dehydrogenase
VTGDERTTPRTCPLCEATCGLLITTRGEEVVGVRGDADDVFSRGFLCPKGVALGHLHHDPDRLRSPMVRTGDTWSKVSWDDAFGVIAERLPPLLAEHGRSSVAVYLGNPNVHDHAASIYTSALIKAIGTDQRYSASTVDQMPKQVASGLMFGTGLSVAVPDIDRTDLLFVLGANPMVSNGSLLTAPDLPGRLAALRARGGRLVVIDPSRTRTAAIADEHLAIRPTTDALLLAAMAQVLFAEDLVDLGPAGPWISGVDEVAGVVAEFTPEVVQASTGIPAATIRRLARELAAAPTAAVYGRMGTTTTAYGTLTSWLVDVLNVLTGNLDRPGGVMFTKAAAGAENAAGPPGTGRGVLIPGRRATRVRGLTSVLGELPVAALAEEIDTPGPGQVRGLITVAGNPARSTPNTARLERAMAGLELMVSIDLYLNETTRHAHVILPGPSPLERDHYDLVFNQLAVRNVARWSPPVFEHEGPDEGEVLLRLAAVAVGTTAHDLDDLVLSGLVSAAVGDVQSPVHGRDPQEIIAALGSQRGATRVLDLMLRSGPYGDGFGSREGLSLAQLKQHPHGLDLGALQPRLPEVLRTPTGRVELAPPQLIADAVRLHELLRDSAGLVLVGRRELRSNNSWMHNLEPMVKGRERCVLQLHPDDAEPLGLRTGDLALVTSRVGSLQAPVSVTADVRPGVVSLPHGWGHDGTGTRVASAHPGVDSNLLTDELALDPLSGTAVLNGIPVTVGRP